MSYAQYGTIAATDFNTLVGTAASGTPNTLNAVWANGYAAAGYGQTALALVSSGNSVAATGQWANLVTYTSNSASHQGTSITAVTAPVSGGTITYLSAIPTNLTSIYTSRGNAATQGSTVANTATTVSTWSANAVFTHTVTFANGDAARYFFNSGGQLNFIISSTANGDSTSRSADLVTLLSTNLVSDPAFRATSGGGNSGTGGTVVTNATNIGYYSLTTSPQTLVNITSTTTSYTSDYVTLTVQSNGAQGSNADKGTVITFVLTIYSAARTDGTPNSGGSYFNDTINITPSHRIDVVYPETTNLTSSWGTVTIA